MDRLQFLKALGLTVGGGVLAKKALLQAGSGSEPGGTPARFKPGPAGRILVSRNGGRDWETHADFGFGCEVLSVRQERQDTVAELVHAGLPPFQLRLDPTGQHWLLG